MVKEDEDELQQRKDRSAVVVQEMSDLVNYVIPRHFTVRLCDLSLRCTHSNTVQGFDDARQLNNCYHMSSFSEKKASKYAAGLTLVCAAMVIVVSETPPAGIC